MNNISASQSDIHRFISKYLRIDGVFILRVVTAHAGVVFGTDLIANLYRSFYGIEETKIERKNKAQKNNENKESESAPRIIVHYNENTVDYEHCPEQNVINHFAQQLAHIRQRNRHHNSGGEDSANLYRASLGHALTTGHEPIPVMNRQFVPKPSNIVPQYTASKNAKVAAQQSLREKERELQEKIEKETGAVISEHEESEDSDDEKDDSQGLETANKFNLA
jgi:hypothetical protein